MTAPPKDPGHIITFYSYKGGTGRSMALANVAWILASNGFRVLVVDWDLEAPGLHRYFAPFMLDPDLVESDGVIDIVNNYVTALMTPAPPADPPAQPPTDTPSDAGPDTSDTAATWYEPYADVLRYATSLTWRFQPCEGRQGWIDLIPAGRQGASYAARMNAFNWQNFYDRLGGGGFIEALRSRMKEEYDYVLIDSRTGVSDTSGVCTVQLPDVLAVCFTLNRQSIEGASAVAASVVEQRQNRAGAAPLRIYPIPMRVDKAEKEKLDLAHDDAADQFAPVLAHVDESKWQQYWGDVEVLYEPFYAYEEVLSTFRDTLGQPTSMLASMERITAWLTDTQVTHLVPADEVERQRGLAKYARQSRKARTKGAASGGSEFLFYISYARADLDESLERFFADLAREVRALTGAAPSVAPGFVDLDIAAGTDWQQQLEQALHVSRVLVPIYSPAYFVSENAGREFQAFLGRVVDASEQTGILPVIWVQPAQLAPVAQRIVYSAPTLPEVYTNLGLRSLMRLRRYEDAYAEFLNEYARRLVEIAQQVRLPSGSPTPLAQIPSAFVSTTAASAPPVAEHTMRPDTFELMEFVKSIPMLNREAIEDVCERELIPRIQSAEQLPEEIVRSILWSLGKRRLYRAIESAAEAVINAGGYDPAVQQFYAAALVRQGKLTPALQVLRSLQRRSRDEYEELGVLQLVGEACKGLYVESSAPLLPASRQNVLRAIGAYKDAYLRGWEPWDGISAVALARRAAKDGVPIVEEFDADFLRGGAARNELTAGPRDVARAILKDVQRRIDDGDAAFLDFAAAAQASLALDAPSDVLTWVASCVHETANSFDLSELLRQLTDVWRLDSLSEAGRRSLPLLRAALLRQEGGALTISERDVEQDRTSLDPVNSAFQNLIGIKSAEMLAWYLAGLKNAWSVVRVDALDGRPLAPGFIVTGRDLGSGLGEQTQYVLTAASVISPTINAASVPAPAEATVNFAGGPSVPVNSIVLSSPPGELDVNVATLGFPFFAPGGPPPLARRPPIADGRNCAYVVSRSSNSAGLSMSSCLVLDHDATRIHLRASTEPTVPGSPVFNRQWELIGLFCGQHDKLRKLNDKVGTYRAGEVTWIGAIRDAIADAYSPGPTKSAPR